MNKDKRTGAGGIALGGLLAAMAVVVMGLGGLIPVATYVCTIICTMFLAVFRKLCGKIPRCRGLQLSRFAFLCPVLVSVGKYRHTAREQNYKACYHADYLFHI